MLRVQDRGFIRANALNVTKTRHTREAAFLIRSPTFLSHPLLRVMSDVHQPSTQAPGNQMGQSIPVNPAQAVAPIPDTSSQALGLEDEGDNKSLETPTCLRRVVEKTVDKLGRSRSLNNKSPSKRIFSLGRNKGKELGSLGATQILLHPLRLVPTSRWLQKMQRHSLRLGAAICLMTLPSSVLPPPPLVSARR